MVRGGRSGRGSTSSGAPSTSVGRGFTPIGSASPTTSVVPTIEVESHHPAAEKVAQPARRQPCWISGKLLWEARDKAAKIASSQDPTTWMDYDRAAKRNQAGNVHTSGSVSYETHNQKLHHELERAPTFRDLFDQTHKQKGTDDYVSESARTIAETYDRTMADRFAEGTPQPYLDLEAWVDAARGPRKGRVYGFGDSLDTTPVLSSYVISVTPPAYASLSAATSGSAGDDIRTLILEELSQQLPLHLGAMLEQLVAAIRGAGTSQEAPQ
ncbi:hypothetical protein Taro_006927, partial [Colocasia esculenta]|nr:hypothetical protein [Colocasia esculenta]